MPKCQNIENLEDCDEEAVYVKPTLKITQRKKTNKKNTKQNGSLPGNESERVQFSNYAVL